MSYQVNSSRLLSDLGKLATFGRDVGKGISRIAFNKAHSEALDWLRLKVEEAGLDHHTDAAGNLFVNYADTTASSSLVIATGSHLDSVPRGGNLDGGLGVLAGLECLRTAKENKLRLNKTIQLIVFNDEEGYYGPMLGSSVFAGLTDKSKLVGAKNPLGETLQSAFERVGLDFNKLDQAKCSKAPLKFIELHIEQGPILEKLGVPIGIVQSICGIKKLEIKLIGEARHSGTTPLAERRDALRCFAIIRNEIDGLVLKKKKEFQSCVFNVGSLIVLPGVANVVPGEVNFTLEVRGPNSTVISKLSQLILETIRKISKELGIQTEFTELLEKMAIQLDPDLNNQILNSCEELGYQYHLLDSGAQHDTQSMANITPSAMIFIPSIKGISHAPEEDSRKSDIIIGANLLLNTLVKLAND